MIHADYARILRAAAASIAATCIVPEPLTVTEWADRYRILPETSASPGPYRSDVTPYARRPQDLLGDPETRRLVLCWAAQTTKSTVIENGVAYRILRSPSPMLVVQPKIDHAEGWAKERFVPMVLATPALRARVKIGRSSGATLRYKPFPQGFLFVSSAQSASELASRSAPFVLCDETDRYEVIPGEGAPVEIVARRMGSSDVGCLVETSTPGDAERSFIRPALEGGTFELYHVPCPLCEQMQPLEWARLKWEKGKPQSARYECAGCGERFDDSTKYDMLAAGEWVPTNPDGAYPSFHLNALYSPFALSAWGVLAEEWEKAQGRPSALQVFVNTRLAECWAETGEHDVDSDALAARASEPYEESTVPNGVGVLTCGVDVQANRLEFTVWGWGAGLESWPIRKGVLPGDPQREPDAPGSVWHELDAVVTAAYVHAESGRRIGISATLVDSGFATSQVYRYTRKRASRRVYAAKGQGIDGYPIIGKPTPQGKQRVLLYPVGVNACKNEFLRSQLPTPTSGPGFVHLPDWLTSSDLDGFVSEERRRRVHRGRVTYEWRQKGDTPTEALDCRNYARAALEILGPKAIAGLGAAARRIASAIAAPVVAYAPNAPSVETALVSPPAPTTRRVPGAPASFRPSRPRGGWLGGAMGPR